MLLHIAIMKRTSLMLSSLTTTVYRGRRVLVPETIKNIHAPKCATCKHFIPDSLDSAAFSKCEKFGKVNLVSGEIKYDFADYCRDSDSKCGQNGTYYVFDEYYKAKADIRKLKPIISVSSFLAILLSSWIAVAFSKSSNN